MPGPERALLADLVGRRRPPVHRFEQRTGHLREAIRCAARHHRGARIRRAGHRPRRAWAARPGTWVACALPTPTGGSPRCLRELGSPPARRGRDGRSARGAAVRGGRVRHTTGRTRRATPNLVARLRELLDETVPGQDLRLHYVAMPPDVFEGFYEVVANPFLWFLQHQMYALPYEPNVDRPLTDAWRTGYRPANRLLADAAVEAADDVERPVFLLQDYHLYLAAEHIRERRPDATILHFTHIPWPPAGIWQMIPQSHAPRDLRRAARGRHRRPPDRPLCVPLPRHGRELRPRCAGRPRRSDRPLARPPHPRALLPDLRRPGRAGSFRGLPGG